MVQSGVDQQSDRSIPVFAANFSGKWTIPNASGSGGGGRGVPTTLTLNQVGTELTGAISRRVEGAAVTFYVWTGADQPAKAIYTGKINAAGDQIAFTVNSQRVVAARSK